MSERSLSNENAIVAKVGGVTIAAQTSAGSDYVKKVTHPPTTLPSGYGGIPDASQPNFIPLEVKAETNVPITFTVGASATTTTTTSATRMLFMQPSGGLVGSYVFYWTGSAWIQVGNQTVTGGVPAITTNTPATRLSGYNFNNFATDLASTRTAYKSTTFYLNATDFNNQGTITDAKFKPNIVRGKYQQLALEMSARHRKSLNDVLIRQFKLDLTDPDADYDIQIVDFTNGLGAINQLNAFTAGAYAFTNVFPQTSSEVLTFSPKGATRMLREGSFIVQQPIQTVQLWSNVTGSSETYPGIMQPRNTVYSIVRCDSGSDSIFAALMNGYQTSTVATGHSDTPWNNLDWSFTLIDGISSATTNVSPPYITVKQFVGIEGSPRPESSSLLAFQKMLPLPDPEALQMAAGIFHSRPDSLPAAANDFGTIAKTLATFLPTAVTWLKGLFAKRDPQSGMTPTQMHAVQRPIALAYHAKRRAAQNAPRQRTGPSIQAIGA
jgi:hypothetical protein